MFVVDMLIFGVAWLFLLSLLDNPGKWPRRR